VGSVVGGAVAPIVVAALMRRLEPAPAR